ncbi:polysaccharide deacetylase family protein [Actinomadura roseirufa]|uniref:polysaccharide deacetylase family protein n=1 Tax=Actinomadura roseirufa TaxID=2094049 RepID=UPI001F5F5121|nr:polysaccharide deacetylase family protein [Actinomadura roseirufa]
MRSGVLFRVVVGGVALVLGLSGCKKAVVADPPAGRSAGPLAGEKPPDWHRWGLDAMTPAPAPPARKPLALGGKGPVKVFSNVPTKDRVVFVTIDDGQEKDPRFVQMLTDLRVPVSMFLTDANIRDHYDYFKPLQALGNHVQNHTLTHPVMRNLGVEGQRREICGDQRILTQRYGTAPKLFRPPFGMWNSLTQEAARECGLQGIVLWRASMQIHDMQYDDPNKKLHPGDVLLAHFRGPKQLKGESMTKMFAAMLKRIHRQGFSVGRLEDYISFR